MTTSSIVRKPCKNLFRFPLFLPWVTQIQVKSKYSTLCMAIKKALLAWIYLSSQREELLCEQCKEKILKLWCADESLGAFLSHAPFYYAILQHQQLPFVTATLDFAKTYSFHSLFLRSHYSSDYLCHFYSLTGTQQSFPLQWWLP